MIDINKAIGAAVKTGKVSFGAVSALQNAKTGKAKMIVVAANCPAETKAEIERYSRLSEVPVVAFRGSGLDLAAACGKPFNVSALSIREAGDSDIMKLVEPVEPEESIGGTE